MLIKTDDVVTLTWVVRDSQNQQLDRAEATEFYVGGQDLLPKIEQELVKHRVGDKLSLYLEPQDAFGDYDEKLVTFEKRSLFAASLTEGMTIASQDMPAGVSDNIVAGQLYTVTEVYEQYLVLDANHPLAGMALKMDIIIEAVRPATAAEKAVRTTAAPTIYPVAATKINH